MSTRTKCQRALEDARRQKNKYKREVHRLREGLQDVPQSIYRMLDASALPDVHIGPLYNAGWSAALQHIRGEIAKEFKAQPQTAEVSTDSQDESSETPS